MKKTLRLIFTIGLSPILIPFIMLAYGVLGIAPLIGTASIILYFVNWLTDNEEGMKESIMGIEMGFYFLIAPFIVCYNFIIRGKM